MNELVARYEQELELLRGCLGSLASDALKVSGGRRAVSTKQNTTALTRSFLADIQSAAVALLGGHVCTLQDPLAKRAATCGLFREAR